MPKQNWRKKSADSRKITTFADCLCAEKTLSSRPFDHFEWPQGPQAQGPLLVPHPEISRQQFNNSTVNNSTT